MKPAQKIALMIVGRVKNCWADGLENTLKYIINELNPVIFVSTYNLDNGSLSEDLLKFKKAYGVQDAFFNVETFKEPESENLFWTCDALGNPMTPEQKMSNYRFCSMHFHNYRAFQMIQASGIKFDYVIKWRSDIIPYEKLPSESFNKESLMIPFDPSTYGNGSWTTENMPSNWCPDGNGTVVGPYGLMKKYCSIFEKLEYYYSEYSLTFTYNQEVHSFNCLYLEEIPWATCDWKFRKKRVYDKTMPNYAYENSWIDTYKTI